jgi:hypothetical protein
MISVKSQTGSFHGAFLRRDFGTIKEKHPMSTPKPPTVPLPPGFAALMALATPRIHAFATEISRLPPEDQTKRIAKVLAAMRGDP